MERAFARIRGPQGKDLPLLARRIGPAGKVHVPELGVDKLARVKVEANQPAAAPGHLLVKLAKLGLALFQVCPVTVGPELRAFFGVEDIEQPAVVERLAVEADLLGLIEIQTDTPTGQ